jgi:hypothetical protein
MPPRDPESALALPFLLMPHRPFDLRRRSVGLGCRASRRRTVVILSGNRNAKQKQIDIASESDENSYLPSYVPSRNRNGLRHQTTKSALSAVPDAPGLMLVGIQPGRLSRARLYDGSH